MTVTLPFTTEQANRFGKALWSFFVWYCRIGLLEILGIGIYYVEGFLIFVGGVFGGVVWLLSIIDWYKEGVIQFKDKRQSSEKVE